MPVISLLPVFPPVQPVPPIGSIRPPIATPVPPIGDLRPPCPCWALWVPEVMDFCDPTQACTWPGTNLPPGPPLVQPPVPPNRPTPVPPIGCINQCCNHCNCRPPAKPPCNCTNCKPPIATPVPPIGELPPERPSLLCRVCPRCCR
ncbi:MAG: hypothetical protein FWB76_08445 [Oscillospiraceae bacterium]|nr:hypothetical protein [Oscillospiraceae bacterium]